MKVKVIAHKSVNFKEVEKFSSEYDCGPVYDMACELFSDEDTYYYIWSKPEYLSDVLINNIQSSLHKSSLIGFMPYEDSASIYKDVFEEDVVFGRGCYIYSTVIDEEHNFEDTECCIVPSKLNKIPTYTSKYNHRWGLYMISAHGNAMRIYLDTAIAKSFSSNHSKKDTLPLFDVSKIDSEIILFNVCQSLRFQNNSVEFAQTLAYEAFIKGKCRHLIASVLSKDSGYPEIAFCTTILNSGLEMYEVMKLLNSGQEHFFGNRKSLYLLGNPLYAYKDFKQNVNKYITLEILSKNTIKINIIPHKLIDYGVTEVYLRDEEKEMIDIRNGWMNFNSSEAEGFKRLYIWAWGDTQQSKIYFFLWYEMYQMDMNKYELTLCEWENACSAIGVKVKDRYLNLCNLESTIKSIAYLRKNHEIHIQINKYRLFLSEMLKFKYSHEFSIAETRLLHTVEKYVTSLSINLNQSIMNVLEKQLLTSWHAVIFDESAAMPSPMKNTELHCPYCDCRLFQKKFSLIESPWNRFIRTECSSCGIIEESIGQPDIEITMTDNKMGEIILRLINNEETTEEFFVTIFIGNEEKVSRITSLIDSVKGNDIFETNINWEYIHKKNQNILSLVLIGGKITLKKMPLFI